ncbi:Serine/arginine-rich splicing factor like [Actinidia chinensis var. chinensis]|uniref:Serine/arginine-rich splicing factor like n=1 Tax=Actinidia chinensis var. chinensis TaxID=1590841 RepID=A0A2R6PT23_ACTCC|nr:Serine/arginine-rich splicing factor like [Actinidia chinensis var. chinensis]
MKSDTALDYAVFQLSPKCSRCELFVSSAGNTEKLASGLVKPFVSHLKVAEEQVALAVRSIKLEVERCQNAETWFTKGTLERFVRFVSTPEVLERVHTFDAEMSQLEAARRIYLQGAGDPLSSSLSEDAAIAAANAAKKELLRDIDIRLAAVRQHFTTACARAAAAGFTPCTVSELQLFADQFGASHLNEACSKFISVCEGRPDLINQWRAGGEDLAVRSSYGSDMSIDEDFNEHHHSGPNQLEQSKHSTWQQTSQPSTTTFSIRHSRESSVDKGEEGKESDGGSVEREKREESVKQSESTQPTRRLSVQDRINLFENKQKENSGKPSAAGKSSAELRRMSSDVLRRWSGASDMSIDLGGEKDFESPLCTPSSTVSQTKSEEKKQLNNKTASGKSGSNHRVWDGSEEAFESNKLNSALDRVESDVWNDQTRGKSGSGSNFCRAEDESLKDQGYFLGGRAEQTSLTDQLRFKGGRGEELVASEKQIAEQKDQAVLQSQTQFGASVRKDCDVRSAGESYQFPHSEFRKRVEGVGSRGKSISQLTAPPRTTVNAEASAVLYKGVEDDSLVEVEESRRKDSRSSEKEFDNLPTKVLDSGLQRMKFNKQVSTGEHVMKSQARKDEGNSDYGNIRPVFSSKMVSEDQEDFGSLTAVSRAQVQRVRQSKGNQELNDELKMKANELEKLFAEHKLRVPGEQSSSAWRNNPADEQIERTENFPYRKLQAEISSRKLSDKDTMTEPLRNPSNMSKFSTTPVKAFDNQDNGDAPMQNFLEFGLSDDSRGKFYEKYTQKRDTKLKEEWGSKRAEKEAKLKAMQENFERSKAEMKAKFSGSSVRQDSALGARQRAERLRSFNARSTMKREQHPIDLLLSDNEEDLSDFVEQKPFSHERSFSETSFGNSASKNTQAKRLLPNKNLPSTTPRTSAAPVPRSATKASIPSTVKRRTENALAQSVPNFSDLRKENTKPSSRLSKTAARTQAGNYARSKSTTEEMPLIKEEKAQCPQSIRKSSASPAEFKDLSPLDLEGNVLAPLKFDKEQTEQGIYDKLSKNAMVKPFLRKGSGIGPGAGAVIAKMKASTASDTINNEEPDELAFDPEESLDVAKDEEEEDSEPMIAEDHANVDNRKPRLSCESDKLINSGSESGDALKSFSPVDHSFVAELPPAVPSNFHPVSSVQHSPAESPASWNSRVQNAFSYAQETSDIDAFADSPMGSPASWNSHSLNQAEADTVRMRKKWGSAQKPIIVSNSSHNHSRKDVTKGFKRLLKFGRKSRGTESLVDWISATTSDGDDDTEDGRDPANRSSEDLRKSRMGFSLGHPSDDSFNESELFSEQVQSLRSSIPAPPANFKLRDDLLSGSSIKAPRSFFSLSSFRSKGSDSKPR